MNDDLDPFPGPFPGPSPDSGITIDVTASETLWLESLPACVEVAERAAREALAVAGLKVGPGAHCEVSLMLANDALVQELNRDYRGKDQATNVLSFPAVADLEHQQPMLEAAREGLILLGDVVLARETLLREAAEQAKAPADHLSHLVVHGVLHLLGYDHMADSEAAVMERLETTAMARLGLPPPYGEDYPVREVAS